MNRIKFENEEDPLERLQEEFKKVQPTALAIASIERWIITNLDTLERYLDLVNKYGSILESHFDQMLETKGWDKVSTFKGLCRRLELLVEIGRSIKKDILR